MSREIKDRLGCRGTVDEYPVFEFDDYLAELVQEYMCDDDEYYGLEVQTELDAQY